MSLPAYAEELKRRLDEYRAPGLEDILASPAFGLSATFSRRDIDCILRDAEIAEAAREWFVANQDPAKDFVLAENDLIALIAKETP
jgi:hypothetical protein